MPNVLLNNCFDRLFRYTAVDERRPGVHTRRAAIDGVVEGADVRRGRLQTEDHRLCDYSSAALHSSGTTGPPIVRRFGRT